jgi:phosphohistidine phosphatase
LTDAGRLELRAAGPLFVALGVRPDVILCSPRERAVETARILQTAGLGGRLVVDARLAPGAEWSDLEGVLADHREADRVMLVGHEPALSSSAERLTNAGDIRLGEGGLCSVEFEAHPDPSHGTLTLLLGPALYRIGMAGARPTAGNELSL